MLDLDKIDHACTSAGFRTVRGFESNWITVYVNDDNSDRIAANANGTIVVTGRYSNRFQQALDLIRYHAAESAEASENDATDE